MGITRQQFCGALTGATALLILQGCGGGGSSSATAASPPAAPEQCGASGGFISGNHGHVLTIDRADFDAIAPKVYDIMGTATHNHTVTFSVLQLQILKAGGSVTVTSSLNGHTHDVTASCV